MDGTMPGSFRTMSSEIDAAPLSRCLNGEDAPCECACPFDFDIREFVAKIKRGSFGSAFNQYRDAVLFPEIASRICPAPCGAACAKALGGAPVALARLERSVAGFARGGDPAGYGVPPKRERVAVVGADLSGLACAFKLASKGYPVTVHERGGRLAPSLDGLIEREVLEAELQRRFDRLPCEFLMNAGIGDPGRFEADAVCMPAVCVPAGSGPDGGASFVRPESVGVYAIASGIKAAADIEWFLRTGNRRTCGDGAPRAIAPRAGAPLRLNPAKVAAIKGAGAEGTQLFSKSEARDEAERCLRCDCSACLDQCLMLKRHGALPKDLAKEVGLSLNAFEETQGRAGMREIGSCNFCGLCEEICPVHENLGAFLLEARKRLFELGTLPPAHHEHWLRDMAFSNSDEACVSIVPVPGKASTMFFPGCRLGGSDPRYVAKTYERLLVIDRSAALLLRCCGAPALWAGDERGFKAELDKVRTLWVDAGKPTMLLACPSCRRLFAERLPEMPLRSIYELLEPEASAGAQFSSAAVFDPCASRDFPETQAAVRRSVRALGIELEELDSAGRAARCCGWGGHAHAANPALVEAQADEQASRSDLPYIVYCANCLDAFSSRGKDCRHALDLILGINQRGRPASSPSESRTNRRRLRRELATAYGLPSAQDAPAPRLSVEAAASRKMSECLILEEDIAAVIDAAERDRSYLKDAETGRRICHGAIGAHTYWVEYERIDGSAYRVFNAYSHRMSIKAEYGKHGGPNG